jgi:Tol biopolymer transport system component
MLCEDCGQLTAWSRDGNRALGNSIHGRVWLLDLASRRRADLLTRPGSHLAGADFSPDDRWISFLEIDRGTFRTHIVPFQDEGPIGESAWIPIASGGSGPWSPDGRLIYFPSGRDGFTCFWAQRLDPATKRLTGDPFPIFHSHGSRRSLANQNEVGLFVGRDKVVFWMGERTGNIWMAEWK